MILPGHDDYRSYSDEELDEFLRKMPFHVGYQAAVHEHQRRQELKDDEANKQRDQTGEHRHKQTLGQGNQILFWTKCAVAAAVIAPIVVALIQEMQPSKTPPSKASQSLQPSASKTEPSPAPLETTAPPSVLPTASPSPSTEESPPE